MIMKLLIVDDNSGMRALIRNLCSNYFTEIFECSDGDEAVYDSANEKPDWIIMDFKMNKMDGITASKLIVNSNSEVKIIIVSQYNDEIIREASIKSGAIAFVEKENLTNIIEIINNHYQ